MEPVNKVKKLGDDHRVFVTEAMVEAGYQRVLDAPDPVAKAAALERHGGPCPYCQTPFARIDVDNAFGKFSFYQPACRCFPVCKTLKFQHGTVPGCGRFLIAEKLAGIDYCTSCYAVPPGYKAKAARTGTGYRTARKASGKDAAAGDKDEL